MAELCQKHSGETPFFVGRHNRAPLDSKIAPLPRSQAGKGAHRCAYCAYLLGYADAKREMHQALQKLEPGEQGI